MPSKCKPKARFIPATCAWTLLLGATSLFYAFPCVYLAVNYHLAIPICQAFLTFFVLANFTLATFMDPGIIPKASADETKDDDFRVPLYKNVEINGITVRMKWCTTCRFYRPPRCSHCSVCNNCIETFDHHCPWVNNCIGRRNYRHFFLFLVSLSVHMISIFALCVVYLLDHTTQLEKPATIVCIAIMVIIFCLIFPILGLTGFHVVLISRGRTTNEQVTGKFRGGYNPFSRGCCQNIGYTLCGPQLPRYAKRRPKAATNVAGGGTASPISTIPLENQVRVYMDTSNGVRITKPNAYCKMAPGPNLPDTGMTFDTMLESSQSKDCEPPLTPPPSSNNARNGSKTNLFDMNESKSSSGGGGGRWMTTNHVDDNGRNDIVAIRSANVTNVGGGGANNNPHRYSPSSHAKSRVDGIARSRSGTPDPLSPSSPMRRSNPSTPGTPTTPRSPGFVGRPSRRLDYGTPPGTCDGRPPLGYPCYPDVRESALYRQRQQQFQEQDTLYQQQQHQSQRSISPQRKFASDSELLGGVSDNSAYVRSQNHTADNLRELASPSSSSPYRPTAAAAAVVTTAYYPSNRGPSPNHRSQQPRTDVWWSHPTSPTSVTSSSRPPPYTGVRRSSGGGGISPPGPKRKMLVGSTYVPAAQQQQQQTMTGGMRRPMSFVKALQVTDSIEMAPATGVASSSRGQPLQQQQPQLSQSSSQHVQQDTADRKSFYDTNYEISV